MKTVNVVAAIVVKDGKALATQRGYGELEGGWEFPGGKIEPGETPEEALLREIREELEMEILVGERLATVEYNYSAFHLSMQCFLCEVTSEGMTLVEHHDARWLGADSIDSVEWLPADIQVVQAIKAAGVLR